LAITIALARNALTLVVENCKAALIAIDDLEEAQDSSYPSSDFPTLRKDFLSLLSLIHTSSTKVALALKPSSPQYKAALTPLKDLSNNVAALTHSIRLMRRDQSATILKEYTSLLQNVIAALESLAHMFLDPTTAATEEYLIRTGTIHDLIDIARKPGGLSITSRDAVRKRWLQNHESIVDGAEEIQQVCNPKDTEGDDFIDDGWEELGINSTTLSPSELDRTEKVGSSFFSSLNNGHPQFTIHHLGTSGYQACSVVTQTCSSRCAFSRCP
jgi:Grap2 and cyclin-D-interacting